LNGNDNITTNKIATENPILKQTYSHENKTNHSHDASPSPTSGYASSSVHGEGISRDSTSPPSAYVPQHDYLNVNYFFFFFEILFFYLFDLFRLDHQITMKLIVNHLHHHLQKNIIFLHLQLVVNIQ